MANTQTETRNVDRLTTIDTARFFGIVLVFYGHLVEQIMYLGNATAAAQYKWIYSFHMPLFFLLAGVVASAGAGTGFADFAKRRFTTRLVPYFFFSFLLAALSLFVPGWFPLADLATADGYVKSTVSTFLGMPAFNIPLWFIAALVCVEVLHYFVGRIFTSQWRLLAGAAVFYAAGYYLNLEIDFFEQRLIFWLVNLAPLGYAFYLLGVWLRRSNWLATARPRWQLAAAAVVCLAGVFLTYDLNQGPFRYLEAVVILLGAPGHFLLFPLTALLGIALVLLLAHLMPARWTFLHYLGRITLLIYCLHGIFYHLVNRPLAGWMVANLPSAPWSIFVFTALATIASVALTVPLAMLTQRYLPFVAGSARWTPAERPSRLRASESG